MRSWLVAALCVTGLAGSALGQAGTPDMREPPVNAPEKSPAPSKKNLVNLRPKLKVGQEARFEMDIKANRSRRGGAAAPSGNPMDMMGDGKQDMVMTVVLKCTSADPETGYALDMTIEKFRMDATIGGESVRFDSTKPDESDPLAALFQTLVGTTMPVRMDKDGNISSVGGGAGALGGMDGASLMKGFFGPIATQSKSPGEAAVGESWTNDDTIEGGMGVFRIKTTNTLKSHARSMATIVTRGVFSLDPSSSQAGIRIREGDMSGNTQWDTETGMLDSMNFRQKLTIEKREQNGQPSVSSDDVTMKVTRVKSRR
jgi:hypothetical protein